LEDVRKAFPKGLPLTLDEMLKAPGFIQPLVNVISKIFERQLQNFLNIITQKFSDLLDVNLPDDKFTERYNSNFCQLSQSNKDIISELTKLINPNDVVKMAKNLKATGLVDDKYILSSDLEGVQFRLPNDSDAVLMYPNLLLRMRGDDLEAVYQTIEPSLVVDKMLETWENQTLTFKSVIDIFRNLIS
jgi:NADH:ubiquinone oxidoreductase subunit C